MKPPHPWSETHEKEDPPVREAHGLLRLENDYGGQEDHEE